MSYSRRSRYSRSRSPYWRDARSISRSLSESRSRSRSRSQDSSEVENPGNNLYVTGLSPRITKKELEKHFSSEGGTVVDVHLVADPWTRESRGFGFVTMSTLEEAEQCLKYLNHSVLEGRVITVEKARRRRGRTPTPGRYLGLKTIRVRRRSPSYSPYGRSRYSSPPYSSERERDRSYSPYYSRHRDRSYSSYYSRHRDRSYSPYYSRHRDRSYSSYYSRHRDRSYSPYYHRRRSPPSRSPSPYSGSPVHRRNRSYSPYDRSISPYYSRRRDYSGSPYSRRRYRSISQSVSPAPRSGRSSRRSYSCSVSPPRRPKRVSHNSRIIDSRPRKSSRSLSHSASPRGRRYQYSSERGDSRSVSSRSRSVSWSH